MRQSNWHEGGGNAKQLKGTVEQALAEHADTEPSSKTGRGSLAGDQPTHVQALYPTFSRRNKK
ncbi:MAG: hypothetical protein V3V10_03175 [Planctomycetota bacterium]